MAIIGIIVAIIIFSIVIIIHEMGHFFASRIFNVRVEEFGLGIPPRAKKLYKDKKGTLYSLNWLPLGGFVKLSGETYLEGDKDKNSLSNKALWQQSIIILAGVLMNFVLSFIIFFILFLIGVKPIGINDTIPIDGELKLIPTYDEAIGIGLITKFPGIIIEPTLNSVALNSGLEYADIVENIYYCEYSSIVDVDTCSNNDTPYAFATNSSKTLTQIIGKNTGNDIILQIKRGSEKLFVPISVPKEGKIGIYLADNMEVNSDFMYQYGVLDSAKYALGETKNQIILTFKGLVYLFDKIFRGENEEEREAAIEAVSGPIGIVDFISNSISAGIIFIVIFTAIISISLGVFNILPIPALDGGRFLLILINGISEKLFKKRIIGGKLEGIVHLLFFVLLIALSILIAYNDVHRIINN